MDILILSQWCHPEPDLKSLTFATQLARDGHNVQILTGFPNYPTGKLYPGYKIKWVKRELIMNVEIIRVPLYPSHDNSGIRRVLNYLSFAFFASLIGPFVVKKAQVVYVYHPPPTVSIPAFFIKFFRRIPIVYDMQDLWPESLVYADSVKKGRLVIKLAKAYIPIMYKFIDYFIVQSNGFKTKLSERGVSEKKISVVLNWGNEVANYSKIEGVRINDNTNDFFKSQDFKILFAGNLGEGQALETILEAAKICQERKWKVHFYFLGDGIKKNQLLKFVENEHIFNVSFLNRVPASEVDTYLSSADCLLVHLKNLEYFEQTIPSKVQAYLKIGKPILIGLKGDSATLVKEAKAGISFIPEDVDSLVDAICKLVSMPLDLRVQMGDSGKKYYQENLSLEIGSKKIVSVFKKVLLLDK